MPNPKNCKNCYHPKSFHGKDLNIPSLPYVFIGGECYHVGDTKQGRYVELDKAKFKKLVRYFQKRYASKYHYPDGKKKATKRSRHILLKTAEIRARHAIRMLMDSMDFPPTSNLRLHICGCKEFK